MALSLDSIHEALNDFFVNQFKADAGSPILFRFDKFGSVISDSDFIDPAHPELGYSAGLAKEVFSDLVNHIPIETDDGLNIILSDNKIDDEYFFHMLSPSLPFVATGTDQQLANQIISSFSQLKADAKQHWDDIKLESSSGLMVEYRPSLAIPDDWYDKSNNGIWTEQTFQVSETTAAQPGPSGSLPGLWKLKVDDAVLQQGLLVAQAWKSNPSTRPILGSTVTPLRPIAMEPRPSAVPQALRSVTAGPQAVAMPATRMNLASVPTESMAATGTKVVLAPSFRQQFLSLNISDRILLNRFVGTSVPTQPVNTNSISISLSYCLVKARRPWYGDTFVADRSWYIASLPQGQLTSGTGDNPRLAVMPIGFVAIRNLSIQATWSAQDIDTAKNAGGFGPFKVDSQIVNGKLSHEGIQVIGWLLQRMPALPPNNPPA